MGINRTIFYVKNNTLKIPAFEARIDKSKAPNRPLAEFEQRCSSISKDYCNSPYFLRDSRQQKPIFCTLLKHEADEYGYKLPYLINANELSTQKATKTPKCHKIITKLLLFTPHVAADLSSVSVSKNQHQPANRKQMRTTRKLPTYSASLKEKLDRNVPRTTRKAMTNACKQYPSLSSRNLLDKYAHLFGLKPVIVGQSTIISEPSTI